MRSMNFVKESMSPFYIMKKSFYEPYPDNVVGPLCFVYKVFLESSHINICEVGWNSGSHCCPLDLVSFAAVIKVVTQCSSPLTVAHSSSAFLFLDQ